MQKSVIQCQSFSFFLYGKFKKFWLKILYGMRDLAYKDGWFGVKDCWFIKRIKFRVLSKSEGQFGNWGIIQRLDFSTRWGFKKMILWAPFKRCTFSSHFKKQHFLKSWMEVSYQTGRWKSCLKMHFLHLESANNRALTRSIKYNWPENLHFQDMHMSIK